MAYNDNQNEYPIPQNSNEQRNNDALLPRYFRTDQNKKFLSATLDQFTNPGVVEKINGFVGRREAKAANINDQYVADITKNREDYQLETFGVVTDILGNVNFDADYLDMLGTLKSFNGTIDNHNNLFEQEFYAWDPHIDFDKFTNFREYYWLPNGPQEVPVRGQSKEVTSTYVVETVVDDDNTAFLITPDGLTRNKSIKLFRGQTYRFEVNAPGNPFGIALSRAYQSGVFEDSALIINPFTDGVTITHNETDNPVIDKDDYIKEGFVENGVLEFTIPTNAPDTLYYISQNDINTSGVFNIFDIEENTEINVEEEIIGKKTYTTESGWEFSNGMKVYFTGEVTPAEYANGLFYVEGVGSKIQLISVDSLEVPATFTTNTFVPFDTNGFDRVPFSDATTFAGTKDYFVISRRDNSKNAWARYNKWFHRDVIVKSAEINNQLLELDQSSRAKRPIIEFEPNLRLYNHGTTFKQNVNLVDNFTKDVMSTIEGSVGYNVDGIDLAEGMRVLFTADQDYLVNGKIFQVKFITHNNVKQIALIETDDTDPILDQTILASQGNKNGGKSFWYNGTEWKLAQDKSGVNQAPLFDLFDKDGYSISDTNYYLNNDFTGNRIFNYRVGEGTNDTELGFPLTYQNFVNIGDIVFDFSMLNKTYSYEKIDNTTGTISSDTLFLKKTDNGTTLVNAWKKANRKSRQYVVRKYTGEEFTNNFPIDVYTNSANLTDIDVRVFVNNDYKIAGVDYAFINENNVRKIVLNKNIEFTDIVIVKTYSSANKNENGYYEIPHNFERNPLNNNIIEFTLGQVNDHVEGLVQELSNFSGIHPGENNLRDLGDIIPFGRKFVKHSGPFNLALYHLVSKENNIVNAARFALNEYTKFKRLFLQVAKENSFTGNVKEQVDQIFYSINSEKNKRMPFYSSDMLGVGGSKKLSYEVLDFRNQYYALSELFDKTKISNKAVNVYVNNIQLTHGIDYEFDENGFVKITSTLSNGDEIEIFEYANTEGSFVPPTPTKIGMYPAFEPKKFLDTSYSTPTQVIQGHDGSLTVAFNDYRDELLLELEKRIFNNLKVAYDTSIFDIHDIIGGQNRNTKITNRQIDAIMIKDFLDWNKIAKVKDYTNNDFVTFGSPFTYNYRLSTSPSNVQLPGFWRGVYKFAYDTDTPHLTPWQMIGFSIKPSWWEAQYGPAPYTSDNLVLWNDLSKGIIREPNKPVRINPKYVRPNLLKHLPVNSNGQVVSPVESGYSRSFSYTTSNFLPFKFGDHGPTETAWRRSSGYPFSLMVAAIVLKPSHVIGVGFDRSRITRDLSGDLIYADTNKTIRLQDIKFPQQELDDGYCITGGFVNWITEYSNTNVDADYSQYITNIQTFDNKIAFKLAGFADKNKLKLVLDSKTPLNKGNVFVPFENYDISLRKSSVLDVVTYSGIIIERVSGGYKINGFDDQNPTFKYFAHRTTANDPNFSVGGISESFIPWAENKIYVAGKIVQYQDKYYRVNQTHTSTNDFDSSKFSLLSSLPIVGGVTATLRKNFESQVSVLDYGTILPSVQEVVDFIIGYGKQLQNQGFVFDYYNSSINAIENWSLSAKEFLFWTTQNWSENSVITLSPGANRLLFSSEYFVVDNIFDSITGAVLNESKKPIKNAKSNIARDKTNLFSLKSDNEGIYFCKLNLIQKEHVVILDNKTVFNDTIYDPETGYRQERLKVVGYRTDGWNGSLNIPGFTYDDSKVTEWKSWKDYQIGDLVKFKEFYYSANVKHSGTEEFNYSLWQRLPERPQKSLTPNWDYKANQFTDFYDLDTDNFDSEQQRLAQHLIGYQKRDYLQNIIQDDVSQYKFYQGFIQDKGTNNALTKLFDKLGSADKDSLEFFEEWAIRVGQYGATSSYEEVEFQLDESKFRIEPQTIELVQSVNNTRTDLVYQYPKKDIYLSTTEYNNEPFPVIYREEEYSKTGGYVKLDQIDFIAKTFVDILALDVDSVDIGDYVWVPENNQTWNVYKHIQSPIRILSITQTANGFEAQFDKPVPFADGEIVGFNNINDEINGFWLARNITYNKMEIYLDTPISDEFIDLSDSTLGIVTQMNSRRVTTSENINDIVQKYDITDNERIWVDDNGTGKFEVFDNKPVFEFKKELLNPRTGDTGFGSVIAVSDNNTIMAVGAPEYEDGEVYIYARLSEASDFVLIQTLSPVDQISIEITNATQTNPVVITTSENHNLVDGRRVRFTNVPGMTDINDNNYYIEVVDDTTLNLYNDGALTSSVDGTGFGAYVYNPLVHTTRGDMAKLLFDPLGKFGTSVSITPDSNYLFVGSPDASNVATRYRGVLDPAGAYETGDIVSQKGTLWRAKVDIIPESSTINLLSQDWEEVDVINIDAEGYTIPYNNMGYVSVYKKDTNNSFNLLERFVSPEPVADEKFGLALKSKNISDFRYRTFIRSATDNGRVYFTENKEDDYNKIKFTKDKNYKGEWLTISKYIENEIVYYDGDLYQANTTVLAGDLFNSSQWTLLSAGIDYLGYIPSAGDGDLLDEDSSEFDLATAVGRNFDVSRNGDVLVIGGYITAATEYRVSVYRYANNRFVWSQNLDAPLDDILFGASIAISDDGSKVAIGAIKADDTGINNGKVYVYKYNNTEFVLDQELLSPDGEKNEEFGVKVDFFGNKLAVMSVNGNTSYTIAFDSNLTYFDNKATELTDVEYDTGQIYVFEPLNNKLVYAEKMRYANNFADARNPFVTFVDNHYYLSAPFAENTTKRGFVTDFRSERGANAWMTNSVGENYVNIDKIRGVYLYDKITSDLITYLDVLDPIQGRIAGPAEQELSYKTYYDPATYNVGLITDSNIWDSTQVGKLWWDLSTVKWFNPYQGNIEYKSNTWNKVIPGFEVDVYEWIQSDLLPSEWDEIADTVEGLANNISGQSKYSDSQYTTTKVYDPVSQTFSNQYFYWVKNKKVTPDVESRKISAQSVSQLISDPAGNGYRFALLLDQNKISLHNVRSLIKDTDTILHVNYNAIEDALDYNIHTEYKLLTEGLASSKPSDNTVRKWVDSLVGYDAQQNQIPSLDVSVGRRYGILDSPLQSMFVNKTEALKQIVERVNNVFSNNLIVDEFDISPLFSIDAAPSKFSGAWDTKVASENLLRFVGTAKITQAKLTPTIVDGVITAVTITNKGRGYIDPNYTTGARKGPVVEIVGTGENAELQTYINEIGQITSVEVVNGGKNYLDTTTLVVRPFSVLVENDSTISGFWSVYSWNSSTRDWFRQYIQSYDVTRYWQYIDWYATGYNATTAIDEVVPGAYALSSLNNRIGSVVKIENIGSGGWLLLEKIDNQAEVDYTVNYKTIGRQNGTIQISQLLYNNQTSGFDNQVYDAVLYDREPINETRIIMYALRDNIFVDQLEVEWNKLFFSSVRYALAEQPSIDWIFKTSLVTAKHNVGELEQKITYQNDNLPNYQDYVNEVKPFSTKVREYISSYEKVDPTRTTITDFDVPPRYDADKGKIITDLVKVINNQIVFYDNEITTYPQKHWLDNAGYEITKFVISNAGNLYTDTANVIVSGGGGPTLTGYARVGGGKITLIDVNTTGAKYYSAPTVEINGSVEEGGSSAKAYAIIGNGVSRRTHMLVKFDRITGNYLFSTLDETQTFTGNGGQTEFSTKWPMSTKKADTKIFVNNEQLLTNDYVVSNTLDTSKGYDRYLGKITFTNAPVDTSTIVVEYKKSTNLLHAVDRINYFYNPKTGMLGKDLSQLMDGIDYGGVQLDSVDFGTDRGFEASPFGLDFDTFDTTFEDEIITLDGSTQVVELANVLESNVQYNVYLNNVRIDDPNFDGSSATANPNAKMVTITGDGISNTVFLDSDYVTTAANDILIVRKSTSDGSFTPETTAYDVSLQGGNFEYTTANGIDAGDIVVDGDGFVTETTSKGPEEQVPGQVLDTMDLQVYNVVNDGQGVISVKTHITDGSTIEYDFVKYPQADTSMIVKLNNYVMDSNDYTIDWETATIRLADSSAWEANALLSILTIGANGKNIIDTDQYIAVDNTTRLVPTNVKFVNDMSGFVTLNGTLQFTTDPANYSLQKDADGFCVIEFPVPLQTGDIVNYTLYEGETNQYSQLLVDQTFVSDGVNRVHRFTTDPMVPLPGVAMPLSHRILVSVDNKFLNPGYKTRHTLTTERAYPIDLWQFEDPTQIRNSDVFAYVNDQKLGPQDYLYDPINGRVQLLSNTVGLAGQVLDIYVVRDAEYYFVDTVVTITNGDAINNYEQGDVVEFATTDDSTTQVATVETFTRNGSEVKIKLQGYLRDLIQIKSLDDTPPVIASSLVDSTQVVISKIECVESDNLTLDQVPAAGSDVNIYVFSNHDINDIRRNTYDVVYYTTHAPVGSDEYIEKNSLSRGYIKLEKTAVSAEYVWVLRNGILQTPNIDYKLTPGLDAVQLMRKPGGTETIEVIQFAAIVSKPKFAYRIFKDMLNRTHYKRISNSNSYELNQPLNYYDNSIVLTDATGIQEPNRSIGLPGVIWVDKERIEYYSVTGNVLRQIRRGTLGTGTPNIIPKGTTVYGQGIEENIPYKDATYTTKYVGDGSTHQFVLDFVTDTINSFDVFVGGRRLRKNSISVFNQTLDQDSPDADETVPAEFSVEVVSVDGTLQTVLTLADIPADGINIQIVRKTGKVWSDTDKSLVDSNNQIANFIKKSTISYPR
jgi:hypothetical protein